MGKYYGHLYKDNDNDTYVIRFADYDDIPILGATKEDVMSKAANKLTHHFKQANNVKEASTFDRIKTFLDNGGRPGWYVVFDSSLGTVEVTGGP